VLRCATFVEGKRDSIGEYPADIAGYEFGKPEFASLITYWPPGTPGQRYVIEYDLFEGETVNREYGQSGWYYYPD
jgi:hypothetical protein